MYSKNGKNFYLIKSIKIKQKYYASLLNHIDVSSISPSKITWDNLKFNGWLSQSAYNEAFENINNDIAEVSWINPIEKQNFDKDPWTYKINRYNFRDNWNFKDSRKRIGFFGCSFTSGEGINTPDTWWHQLGSALNLNIMNFGIGGSSIERVARTFSMIDKLIHLDYIIFLLPSIYRILYATDRSGFLFPINLIPSYPYEGYEKIHKIFYKSYDNNKFFDVAVNNINWILDSSKNKKICFASWCPDTHYILNQCSSQPLFPVIFANLGDKARDEIHPGIDSNREFAKVMLEFLNDISWVS